MGGATAAPKKGIDTMKHFTKDEDNMQFISIKINDGTNTDDILTYISKVYPSINKAVFDIDTDEIVINAPAEGEYYNFSLNDLRCTVSNIADAEITMFCVDINSDTQTTERRV